MKLKFRSKNEIAYNALLDEIVRGEIKPGERLVIDLLAETMSISQIPIREALRQLETDGFVTLEPNVGFTVTPIHADLIAEVFALLEATEVFSSRRACQMMGKAQLDEIEAILHEMDTSTDNPSRWSEDNKRLHQFISDCAKTSLIGATMRKALAHWDRLQMHYFRDVLGHRLKIAQKDHWELLASFRAHDPEAVERVIHSHNQAALAAYLQYLQDAEKAPRSQEREA